MEEDAYNYMSKQGSGIIEHSSGAKRTGAVFRTPLSREPHRFNAETLRSYVDSQCGNMEKARIDKMGALGRWASKAPHLFLFGISKGETYDIVRDFITRADGREVFCSQLSDQLVYCQECSERLILYNILKDEDAMRIHLTGHHESSDARKAMNDLLLSI